MHAVGKGNAHQDGEGLSNWETHDECNQELK